MRNELLNHWKILGQFSTFWRSTKVCVSSVNSTTSCEKLQLHFNVEYTTSVPLYSFTLEVCVCWSSEKLPVTGLRENYFNHHFGRRHLKRVVASTDILALVYKWMHSHMKVQGWECSCHIQQTLFNISDCRNVHCDLQLAIIHFM